MQLNRVAWSHNFVGCQQYQHLQAICQGKNVACRHHQLVCRHKLYCMYDTIPPLKKYINYFSIIFSGITLCTSYLVWVFWTFSNLMFLQARLCTISRWVIHVIDFVLELKLINSSTWTLGLFWSWYGLVSFPLHISLTVVAIYTVVAQVLITLKE